MGVIAARMVWKTNESENLLGSAPDLKEGAASLMPAIAASPRAMPASRVRHRGRFCGQGKQGD